MSHITPHAHFKKIFLILYSSLLISGCGAIRNSPKYELGDDYYGFRQGSGKYQKVFAYVEDDTIRIFSNKNLKETIIPESGKDQFFLKRSFDVDVMTVGFKYRPISENFPRQLNTDFNGNIYLGYRFDRFRINYRNTPGGLRKKFYYRGITAGGFCGLGASAITPWTTNNRTTDEYNGFILSRGLAVMIGANNLTVGVGVGWDYLTDRDKNIWIYQNKPWYGLAVGLNLN